MRGRAALAWVGVALALFAIGFVLGRRSRPLPGSETSLEDQRVRTLELERHRALERSQALEAQIATLRQSIRRVRVESFRANGTRDRTTTTTEVATDARKEAQASASATRLEVGGKEASTESTKTSVQYVERALPKYRLGLDVGATLKNPSPTFGGNGAIRLGGTSLFLTGALVPTRGELRVGLAWER